MKKNTLKLLACMLIALIVLSACGGNQSQPQTPTDGSNNQEVGEPPSADEYTGKTSLVIASPAMPRNLDPALTNDQASSRITKQIYDTLLNQDDDFNILPGLAESWELVDETTLSLQLKQDVYFHNGELFTAEDVKFSIERAAVSPFASPIIGMVSEVIVNGDYDVTIKLAAPFSPILAHLTHPCTAIVNKTQVEAVGDDAHGENPIGTGPFMFDKLVAGDRVELVRWDRYHGQLPLIEHINIRTIPEAANRAIEIETGSADLAFDIVGEDISRIEDNPNTVLYRDLNYSTTYIGFNTAKEPFNDARVRQAINYALDKDAIVRSVYRGTGAPARGPLADTVWAAADLEPFDYNFEKARELLAEAGYADGFSTTIWTNENVLRADIAQIVNAQLANLNIKVEVSIIEWASYLDRTAVGEHEMMILGWTSITGDPDYGLYGTFHSTQHGSSGNRSFYTNTEVDRLLDEGRFETDPAKREQIYAQAQQIIRDDAPWIFTWQGEELSAASSNLRGFKNSKTSHHPLWNIYFE